MSDVDDLLLEGTVEDVLGKLGKDLTAGGMLAFLHSICVELTEQGWDIPPMLYTVERNLPPGDLADQLAEVGQQAMMLTASPIQWNWGGVGIGWEQAQLMHRLAAQIRKRTKLAMRAIGNRDIVAWAYITEGWGFATTDEAKVWHDGERRPRIETLPNRVEYRMLTAVDRAGHRYVVWQQRGKDPTVIVDRSVHPDDEDESNMHGIVGNIPDAIADLADALPVAVPE